MIRSFSDDDIDAMVRSERPEAQRSTVAWRQAQRNALLDHINGTSDGSIGDRPASEWSVAGSSRSPQRRWGWAAAGVMVAAGVAALAIVPGRSDDRPGPADEPPPETIPAQVTNMTAPGITVSPEVVTLLALPACESADGLAEWTAEQLDWWRTLDPSTAQPAEFSAVTAQVAVDTGAMSATCSAAISLDGALTWGLGDGSGNWVARAAGVPGAVDYEWPTVERERDGDDGTGGQFGTGQFFNDFNIRTTDLEAVAAGALSPARSDSPSPIYVIEFAEEIGLDSDPSRLWYLRTTTPALNENVSGPPNPALVPSLVPEGFGRCTVEYGRTNTQGIGALAVDYCDTTSTITVTADKVAEGEPSNLDGIEVLISRIDDTVRVGFAVDGPVVIGPASVPDADLAAMLASISAVTADAAPQTESTVQAAVGSAYEEAMASLQPSNEYSAAVWTATELLMSECMANSGFDWLPRPNEAADPTIGDQWQQWEDWFDSNTATDSDFETTAFGVDDTDVSNVGGCQLTAFQEVYGPGEEAFSKAANLTNEALAAQSALVGSLDPAAADLAELAEADAEQWLEQHSAAIEQIRQELDEELDNARSIISDRQETTGA